MSSKEINAAARARQDWMGGASYDENPFLINTYEYTAWQREMNGLVADEIKREMMEPSL